MLVMKKYDHRIYRILLLSFLVFCFQQSHAQILKKIKDRVKQTTEDKITDDASNAIDRAGNSLKTKNNKQTNSTDTGGTNISSNSTPQSITAYQNYDFVPGDSIIFTEDFSDDMDGEFPSRWTLSKGQAVVNKINGIPAFLLTEGNYCQVNPRMKTTTYLTDPFTIEFDYYANKGDGPGISFDYKSLDGDYTTTGYVEFNTSGEVSTFDMPVNADATYPNEDDATYRNKWHHCALIYKNNEVKCYIDQYRILVIPTFKVIPTAFGFAGIGDVNNPIIITNIRAASGGNMNMIGKKFTESKIVTHGITFGIDKADITAQSMGTLTMIAGVLKSNPDLKFEIDGYTDNTGEAAHNLTLSQQRSDAVKSQLVKMGIDAGRLTTKGFGDAYPISDNVSPEGRANNRRVVFVKM